MNEVRKTLASALFLIPRFACILLILVMRYGASTTLWCANFLVRTPYRFVVRSQRMLGGVPTWARHDLALGWQPVTPVEIGAARLDETLMELDSCMCERHDPATCTTSATIFVPKHDPSCTCAPDDAGIE